MTFARAATSEWIKLATLRSTWITLAAAAASMVLIGAIASAATYSSWSSMSAHDRATFSPVTASLIGVRIAELIIGVLGVLVISGECGTGMIRSTLAAVPKRTPVLWAKLVVFAALAFVVTTAAAFASFELGQALLHSHGTTLTATALRAVVGVGLYSTALGAIALALGFILRSTVGGITSFVALTMILPVLMQELPSSWQNSISPYLPTTAGSSLWTFPLKSTALSPWAGFAVMCAWAIAGLAAAWWVLIKRDA